MRLLALRGENLASLAAPFSLDFESAPLRDAGIIAITGPTGAGKSTLLDALCLALFDSVPRLAGGDPNAAIGRDGSEESLAQTDVRALLRHGAVRAYAEVDFEGRDGKRYGARWEVKRSRGAASGRLQSSSVTLRSLTDGRILGDKKKDTLARIETALGLSFEQFRRAVLLAQGEFDSFLRAASKDRAELLERITGATIYSALSRAAYERAAAEGRAIVELRTRAGEHKPLDDAARGALDQAHQAAREAEASLARERAALQARVAWQTVQARLHEETEAATATLAAAEAAVAGTESLRTQLDALRRAVALKPLLDALRSAEARHQADFAERQRCDQASAEAAGLREAARLAATEAEASAHEAAWRACREFESALARARESEATARGWLAANAALGRIAGREAELAADIAARYDCLDRLASIGIIDVEAARAAALASQAALRATLDGFDRNRLERARRVLDEAGSRLDAAARDEATAAAARDASAEAASAAQAHHRRAAEAAERRVSLLREIAEASGRIEAAEHVLAWLDAAASDEAARLRVTLVPGDPCPVCGATEHAGLEGDQALRRRRDEDRALLASLRRALDLRREAAGAEEATEAGARQAAVADEAVASRRAGEAAMATEAAVIAREAACAALQAAGFAAGTDIASERARIDAALDRLADAQTQAARVEASLREIDEAARVGREEASLAARIAAVLGEAHPAWRADASLADWCAAQGDAWRQHLAAAEELAREVASYGEALAAAAARLQALQPPAFAEPGDTVEPLPATAAALRARHDEAVAAALSRHRDATQRFRAAERMAAEAEAGAAAARRAEDGSALALGAASRDLAAGLDQARVARAFVEGATEADAASLAATIAEAEAAAREAAAILAERRRREAMHAATAAPDAEGTGDPAEALATIEARLPGLEAERRRLDLARVADDSARASLDALREAVASREAGALVWQQLNELIGSADGTKFRRFAQSLTLDQLIGLANLQLHALAPRYELQRAPIGELALQVVDRDMGDEVRGLANLSGGERFLLSLALSLGLAELSSGRGVRVQSLFIDEGFGALDRDSLAQAIGVLEQLQATGRQVAVISHIEEVKERILVKIAVTPAGGGRSRVAVLTE